ncbi:hypothetical protein HJC23_005034 [Cyclotella cryptica]|uniref:AAA+ ATPase domain-containing protein n=1 Tax=Cyclotella cryptica TaxID=29204 RepID=A0ABD3QFV6_9STRA|eukprot:CCRYP_006255-RA/>CCRYP_006255-RA protein AED:0.24 eAED:0.24 QI:56/1/1/1/0.8/0.66/6/2078/1052
MPHSFTPTMISADTALQKFISEQKRLLELELRADEEQSDNSRISAREDGGTFTLRNVNVVDVSVGLYGRTVVSFGPHTTSHIGPNGRNNSDEQSDNRVSPPPLPILEAHRLTVGDDVEILPKNGHRGHGTKTKRVGGVVCAVDDFSISVALADKKRQISAGKNASNSTKKVDYEDVDEDSDMLGGPPPYTLVPRSGVEIHQKIVSALEELGRYGTNHPIAGDIILSAFDSSKRYDNNFSRSEIDELQKECNLASTKLDYSQREAVIFALHSDYPISLIHGPPGTGKTTTVAELIRCAVHYKNWRVLVAAPSNVAVDNVLDRLMYLENESRPELGKRKSSMKSNSPRIKAVRLGHPARIQHGIQKYSLESLVHSSDGTEIVQDCRRELSSHLKTLSDPKSRSPDKRNAYREMKSLRKEIKSREEKVVGEVLRNANVVLSTNVGAAGSMFKHLVDSRGEPISFDLVIIDEAAQALEATCWISLLRGKRAVLAGDHCQLPPTIKSLNSEVRRELGKTLFERLMKANKDETTNTCSRMLEVQYRMHEDIANWASKAMYDGKLISHESVRHRKLSSLSQVEKRMNTEQSNEDMESSQLDNVTLLLVDTTGCGFTEMTTSAGSRYNEGEAELVASHVNSLLSLGLRAEDIAVITPYNGQVELLRKRLLPKVPRLEIRSVDGFQGGEREAVVLSLVRSSERCGKDGIGFLRDKRRLNVAITRAKRHCALICDCETVSQDMFIKGLIEWIEQKGEYRSGAELLTSNESSTYLPPRNCEATDHVSSKTATNAKGNTQTKTNCDKKDSRSREKSATQDALKEGATRRSLMKRITSFSETGKKGEELILSGLSDFDLVVAKELASQLGLGRRDTKNDRSEVTLYIVKEIWSNFTKSPENTSAHDAPTSHNLDVDDDESSVSSESTPAQNSVLKNLALARESRQNTPKDTPSSNQTKCNKGKKKKKGVKLGGEKKPTKECQDDNNLDELDDMAFLDAQITKVQTSHGRKIEAKGKGYKSIINGVLMTKYDAPEVKKTNTAASSCLHAKIKAKVDGRQVKKKKGK